MNIVQFREVSMGLDSHSNVLFQRVDNPAR